MVYVVTRIEIVQMFLCIEQLTFVLACLFFE